MYADVLRSLHENQIADAGAAALAQALRRLTRLEELTCVLGVARC